jgi:hypothetical protein
MNTGKGYHFVCIHTVQTALLSSRKVQAFRSQTMESYTPLFIEQLVNGGLAVERMRNGQRRRGNTFSRVDLELRWLGKGDESPVVSQYRGQTR